MSNHLAIDAATAAPAPGLAVSLGATNIEQARRKLSDLLELEDPVSEDVLISALKDPLYATHLFASRNAPRFFDMLIARPPLRADDADTNGETILAKFADSMKNWARAGFRQAAKEVTEARLAACQACPNLKGPKGSLMNRLSKAAGLGDSQCGLCGCYVAAKARMATETCPDIAPDKTTRWSKAEAALPDQ